MTPESNAQTAAATIAAELGQPTRGKGVDRLAAALADDDLDAPEVTDRSLDTITEMVKGNERENLRRYIGLLVGVAHIRGRRLEIRERMDGVALAAKRAEELTAPLDFIADGSPADTLPARMGNAIEAFSDAKFLQEQKRAQWERDIERCDEEDYAKEQAEKFDTGAD